MPTNHPDWTLRAPDLTVGTDITLPDDDLLDLLYRRVILGKAVYAVGRIHGDTRRRLFTNMRDGQRIVSHALPDQPMQAWRRPPRRVEVRELSDPDFVPPQPYLDATMRRAGVNYKTDMLHKEVIAVIESEVAAMTPPQRRLSTVTDMLDTAVTVRAAQQIPLTAERNSLSQTMLDTVYTPLIDEHGLHGQDWALVHSSGLRICFTAPAPNLTSARRMFVSDAVKLNDTAALSTVSRLDESKLVVTPYRPGEDDEDTAE